MERLHKVELDILKEFIKVCNKLDLKYYCVGGTAIGVVRHHGFIPWDDDIDVSMPREDYDRFLKEGQKHLPEHLYIQNPKDEVNCPWYFAKIRNSNTTFVEEKIKDLDINHGVYIDIFPIDKLPDDERKREKIFSKYLRFHEIQQNRLYGRPYGDNTLRGVIRKIYYNIYAIPYMKTDLKKKILNMPLLFDNSKKSQYSGTLFGMYGKNEIVKTEYLGEGEKMLFEDCEVIIPTEYDKYLTHIYGDYMKLPPKENRVAPHTYFVDLDNSYLKYKVEGSYKWPK